MNQQTYIRVKQVDAYPSTLGEYMRSKGDPIEPGPKADTTGYVYVSQSSKRERFIEQRFFEKHYSPIDALNFSVALHALKAGYRVARVGWNEDNVWLALSNAEGRRVSSKDFWSPHNQKFADSIGGSANVLPCVCMKTAEDNIVMGWSPTQEDLFANDWEVLND